MIGALKEDLSGFEGPKIQKKDVTKLLEQVAMFEVLMMIELAEWVAIIARDRLALAP